MDEAGIWGIVAVLAFRLLYLAVILFTIVIVLLDNRNPVKTMAWVLVLVFLPVVGLAFYFFFGRNTRKERLISKKGFSRLSKRPMAEYQAQEALGDFTGRNQLIPFFHRAMMCRCLPTGIPCIRNFSTG